MVTFALKQACNIDDFACTTVLLIVRLTYLLQKCIQQEPAIISAADPYVSLTDH